MQKPMMVVGACGKEPSVSRSISAAYSLKWEDASLSTAIRMTFSSLRRPVIWSTFKCHSSW